MELAAYFLSNGVGFAPHKRNSIQWTHRVMQIIFGNIVDKYKTSNVQPGAVWRVLNYTF